MRKKLCLGGTFNPIHLGHLICARAAMEAVKGEGVTLFPAGQSPHKLGHAEVASAEDRAAMCRAATMELDGFEVDEREIRRTGPSFTIQTVRELREEGFDEVGWLIGTDLLAGLASWHEAEALLKEVHFVVMSRPGSAVDWNALPTQVQKLRENLVEVPQIDISSTEIRRRVRAGQSIDLLTTSGVCRYIVAKRLYR